MKSRGLTSQGMSQWSIRMITDKHKAFGSGGQMQLGTQDTSKHKRELTKSDVCLTGQTESNTKLESSRNRQ